MACSQRRQSGDPYSNSCAQISYLLRRGQHLHCGAEEDNRHRLSVLAYLGLAAAPCHLIREFRGSESSRTPGESQDSLGTRQIQPADAESSSIVPGTKIAVQIRIVRS